MLGGKVHGWSDREMAALILVEDASKDGRGVEIWNTIGVDWTDVWVKAIWGPEVGVPEPSKLT